MPDGAPGKPKEDRLAHNVPDHDTRDEREKHEGYPLRYQGSNDEPDVLLDVPVVKVDEIDLEVADLQAQVSLRAEVLDLLKLHVGADVTLGRVALKIKGVEAQALLKVRLDNVAAIIERVLLTIERNPQILEHVTHGLEVALEEVGRGASETVGEIGRGGSEVVEEVGRGTSQAVEEVSAAGRQVADEVGGGARSAVEHADATAEAPSRPKRPSREVPRGADQAARRASPRPGQTEQAEQSAPRRVRKDQAQRSRTGGRARPKQRPDPDEQPQERAGERP